MLWERHDTLREMVPTQTMRNMRYATLVGILTSSLFPSSFNKETATMEFRNPETDPAVHSLQHRE